MKFLTLIFIFLVVSGGVYSQKKPASVPNRYAAIDRTMERKNDSLRSIRDLSAFIGSAFKDEEERCRAVFYWITRNISYAPDLMYTYKINNNRTQLVSDVFDNKKGVCIGYAVMADTLFKLLGFQSFIVGGSTAQSFLPSVTSHAWNAVRINNSWKLMDATWGSGYLQNKKFVQKRNELYFLPAPEKLILTHLPLDPIWQQLALPVTLYQFYSHSPSTVKQEWHYEDSIAVFLQSGDVEQLNAQIRRLAAFGNDSEITSTYYQYYDNKRNAYYTGIYNSALNNYNDAVQKYNAYIDFKNKQFTPNISDAELAAVMPDISGKLNAAEADLKQVSALPAETYKADISRLFKSIADMRQQVTAESAFVNKYLSTKKNKRRDLFYTKTYSWFGIPIE